MTRKTSLARLKSQVLGHHVDSAMDLLFEKRVLIFMTWFAIAGVIIWLASVATDFWIVVIAFNPEQYNISDSGGLTLAQHNGFQLNDSERRVFLWSHSGLWRRCDIFDGEEEPFCEYHHNFLFEKGLNDEDFLTTEFAFVVIVIIMIFVAAAFSIYSIIHPRYMFKRLSGFLHIMTTITLLVVVELVKSERHMSLHNIHEGILNHCKVYFGYSYLLAWTVFIIYAFAGLAFLMLSKKRKYLKHDFSTTLK